MIKNSVFLNNCGLKISYADEKLTNLITELVDKGTFEYLAKAMRVDAYWMILFLPVENGTIDSYLMNGNCPLRQYSQICTYESTGNDNTITYRFMNGDGEDIYNKLFRANKLKAFL